MPQIHIAGPMGRNLDVSDEFGGDYDVTELNGQVVKIIHATRDQVVFEVIELPTHVVNERAVCS